MLGPVGHRASSARFVWMRLRTWISKNLARGRLALAGVFMESWIEQSSAVPSEPSLRARPTATLVVCFGLLLSRVRFSRGVRRRALVFWSPWGVVAFMALNVGMEQYDEIFRDVSCAPDGG